jgi:predicted adenylyl cyclase CyaB
MSEENNKTLGFHEFEVKFRVEGDLVYEFKKLVGNLQDLKDFIYIESDDVYYIKDEDFLRHRFSNSKKDKRSELTFKKKLNDGNNIKRIEYNVRVDNNSVENIAGFVEALGFKRGFRIGKLVHIYRFKDATLPFYTVIDELGKIAHFIEIEVDEESLHDMTEEQAWAVIQKYEAILAPLGITPQKRLRKSLFEMYRNKNDKKDNAIVEDKQSVTLLSEKV